MLYMSIIVDLNTMTINCNSNSSVIEKSYKTLGSNVQEGYSPSLTGLCPHKELSPSDHSGCLVYSWITPPFKLSEHSIRLTSARSSTEDIYPYAVTFTFNSESMQTKSHSQQWSIFTGLFDKWKSLFLKRMNSLCDTRYIECYEIYPELTKSDTIHAHGLLYFNSNYYSAVSKIMTKTWVDKTKMYGNRMIAQKKANNRGNYDYAFDHCNNVISWRKYITKEHSQYTGTPCLMIVEDTMDFQYNE